jgi:hypothetical protein
MQEISSPMQQETTMKKTSRRKFGKQLTGALVALPAAAIAMEQNSSAQDQKKASTPVTGAQRMITSHNTPPDLVITEGSLHFESYYPFTPPGMGGQAPFRYVSSGHAEIGHIRVLQDNGDRIYEDIESDTQRVRVLWEDDTNAPRPDRVLIFAKDGSDFVVTSDQRLTLPGASPAAAHRPFKFRHPGTQGRPMRIRTIEITNEGGMVTSFTAPPPAATDGVFMPHEFRILIWRH